MRPYPIVPVDGYKLTLEEVAAGWLAAGVADDVARAPLTIPLTEASARLGWCVPENDGQIVKSNGATGKVAVRAFTGYRSPLSPETQQDLLSAYLAATTYDVTTPLPTAGNHRWDLLYAIVSAADGSAASRYAQDTTGVNSSASRNTRHAASVALAWVTGTSASVATDPYPLASMPALPAAPAGMAHIPLAYVSVHYAATPSAVTYDIDRIWNIAPVAKGNPGAGFLVSGSAPCITDDAGVSRKSDAVSIITGPTSANGGWDPALAAKRPYRAHEPQVGGSRLWIPVDIGAGTFTASWAVLTEPITSMTRTDVRFRLAPFDFRNRWFFANLQWMVSTTTVTWAHDRSVAAGASGTAVFPTMMPAGGALWGGLGDIEIAGVTAGAQMGGIRPSMGNSVRENSDFNTEAGFTGYTVAAMWRSVRSRASEATDLALLVKASDGGLYLAGREAANGHLDGKSGLIILDISDPIGDYGL